MTTLRHRTLNYWWAALRGYAWLPCPICGREFGGHEWNDGPNGEQSSIPTEVTSTSSRGRAICPVCTAKGVGDRAWEQRGIYRYDPSAEDRP